MPIEIYYIENELAAITKELVKKYPEMMASYELAMVELYVAHRKNDKKTAMELISGLIKERSNSARNEADLGFRVLLNSALIANKFNEKEYSSILLDMAEQLMRWSAEEKVYSPAYMLTYLQVAELNKEHGDMAGYYAAMVNANRVFVTHYDVLKSSFFAEKFNKKEWVNIN